MPKFTSPRDITVASKFGHAIRFAKNVATDAPAIMADELAAAGIMPVEGENVKTGAQAATAAERKAKLYETFDELVKTNQVGDFTAGGVPNDEAVKRLSGLAGVSKAERESAWLDYKLDRKL